MEKDTVQHLVRECVRHGLEHVGVVSRFTCEELSQMCNGIGPECFPAWARAVLDKLHPALQAPSLIHDVDFTIADGSMEMFIEANDRLYRNGKTMAFDLYEWWDVRRYIVWRDAKRLSLLCRAFGWSAYCQSTKANHRDGNQ